LVIVIHEFCINNKVAALKEVRRLWMVGDLIMRHTHQTGEIQDFVRVVLLFKGLRGLLGFGEG